MAKFDGKVAFVTGGARGQGRSHALALAREGANIVFCDIVEQLETVAYPMSTPEDMDETIKLVEGLGRKCLGIKADISDFDQVMGVVDQALEEFNQIDFLLANAGIMTFGFIADMSATVWQEMIDVCLTGVFNAMRATVPHMIARNYGRVIATSSGAGKIGFGNLGHYCAAKWGVIGLVKSLAREVAANGITVNALAPTEVETKMIMNDATFRLFRPDLENPTAEDIAPICQGLNALPIPWIQPEDVSNVVVWLCSDDAHYTTGHVFSVDAGRNSVIVGN